MVALGTDNKKKLMVLGGLAGVLGILVLVVVRPFGGAKTATPSPASTPAPAAGAPPTTPGGAPGMPGGPPGGLPAAAGSAASGSTASAGSKGGAATLAGLPLPPQPARADPFLPYYIPALPPVPTPVPLPPPIPIPAPGSDSIPPLSLPGAGNGGSPAGTLISLPPPHIPNTQTRSAPQNWTAPVAVGEGGRPTALRSTDKRLSGVIMGDSISALLEISSGQETITRVVQPGDEVEGIKILRIGRVDENGTQTMRMFVLENGQERFVDLRPAPQGTGTGGAAGGLPGAGTTPRGRTGPPGS